MKERPILFKGEMVRAILDRRKTQTRRVFNTEKSPVTRMFRQCPFGKPGDHLWVREGFSVQPELWAINHGPQPIHYLADSPRDQIEDYVGKPSIHMPRWASRITLEITGVRVERLQDISQRDVFAEGITNGDMKADESAHQAFRRLWDSINANSGFGWDVNPWVWVVEFRRIQKRSASGISTS